MSDTDWLEVVSFRRRPGSDKVFAAKVGSARIRDDGKVDVFLDALPLPDENGQVKLQCSPRRQQQRSGGYGGGSGYRDRPGASAISQRPQGREPLDDAMDDGLPPWT